MFAAAAMAGRPPLEGPLKFQLTAHMPIPVSWSAKKRQAAMDSWQRPTSKPDLDNIIKLVKDAINCIVWRDDAQVVRIEADKFYSDTPRVDVTVIPLEPVQ
jgi:Holliday junction resolvase RusA-like endonuclease